MDFVLRHDTVLAFIKLHMNHDYTVWNNYIENFLESVRFSKVHSVEVDEVNVTFHLKCKETFTPLATLNDELTATKLDVLLPKDMVFGFLERKQKSAKYARCDGEVLTLMPQAQLHAPLKDIADAFVTDSFVVFTVTEKSQEDLETEAIAAGAFIDSEQGKHLKRKAQAKL